MKRISETVLRLARSIKLLPEISNPKAVLSGMEQHIGQNLFCVWISGHPHFVREAGADESDGLKLYSRLPVGWW